MPTNNVIIKRGVTAIYLNCLSTGRLTENPAVSIFKFLQQFLTEYEYDYRAKMNKAKYFYYRYDKVNNLLHMPINIQNQLESYFKLNLVEYTVEQLSPIDAQFIDINKISDFKDRDYQKKAIGFIMQPGMKALELQTGCLVGKSSNVVFSNGKKKNIMTLDDAYNVFDTAKKNKYLHWYRFTPIFVQSLRYNTDDFSNCKIFYNEVEDITYSGIKPCLRLTFENNFIIECTYDHPILTELGWIMAVYMLNQVAISTYQQTPISVFYSQCLSIEEIGDYPTYDIRCKDPYHNFVANGIVVHNSGKTYTAVRAITELKKRTMIVVPASLMIQWGDALQSISDAKVDVLRGSKSIYDIIKRNYEVDTDVFLASVNTLQDYASGSAVYNIFPSMSEFVTNLKIGIKIIDECHINFNSNTIIDIMCGNIEHNIYLSATYIRSSKSSNQIFNRIFPDDIKFDGDRDYERYVNITELKYTLGDIDEKYTNLERGYSQHKLEKYFLKRPTKLNQLMNGVILPTIDNFFVKIRKDNEKLLIIVGTQDFASMLENWIQSEFSFLKVISFLYGTADEELEKADVIVSTPGSCGTGRDLPNLRSMILFNSFSSQALTLQTLGRLRKLKDSTPEFIYLVNTGILAHKRHAFHRKKTYQFVGKTFQSICV